VYLDAQTLGKTIAYIRNSYFHDFGAGGENMAYLNGRNATLYCYNNVFKKPISLQRAIEIEPYAYGSTGASGTYYVFNNTGYLDNSTPLVHIVNRNGAPKPASIIIRNNHVIGTGVAVDDNGPAGSYTRSNNLIQTLATANSQGYTEANNFSPANPTGSTVDAGFDISSIFSTDRLGLSRPQGSAWDIGAYEFGASSTNPVINISSSGLNFGSLTIGASKDLSVTLRNIGGGTLSGSVSVATPFSVVTGGTYSLASGASQTVTLRYTPTTQGSNTSTALFSGGGGASVALAGSATDPSTTPVIAVAPTSLDFGSIALGGAKDLNITIQNAGAGTLSGTATTAGSFSILAGGSYNLGAGQSQIVTIRFTASAQGLANGTISCTGGGGATVPAKGTGIATASGLSFASTSGTISAPFISSGGFVYQTIQTGLADGGRAVYGFNISEPGEYVVSINLNAPDDSANSFFINIDGEPTDPAMIWDVIPVTGGPENRLVGWRGNGAFDAPDFPIKTFALSPGAHQLVIIGREANAQLGTITIVLMPKPPQNLRIVITP
jgi:hypothetical protein